MPTRREGVISLLRDEHGLSDREITNRLEGKNAPQQPFNQLCRRLENEGILTRKKRRDGKIGNYLNGSFRNEKIDANHPHHSKNILTASTRKPAGAPLPSPIPSSSLTDTSRRRVVLISCAKSKLNHPAKARDLYISPQFQKSFTYANILKPDAIFILSAKYGLVEPDQVISPYEKTLKNLSAEKRAWAGSVLTSLRQHSDLKSDLFIILAGQDYRKYLLPELRYFTIPLEGLSQGRQLQELNRRLS